MRWIEPDTKCYFAVALNGGGERLEKMSNAIAVENRTKSDVRKRGLRTRSPKVQPTVLEIESRRKCSWDSEAQFIPNVYALSASDKRSASTRAD